MNFGDTLVALHGGSKMCRSGWNGKDMWVAIHRPDPASHLTLPYLYIHTATGDEVPWVTSQADILADDWAVAS